MRGLGWRCWIKRKLESKVQFCYSILTIHFLLKSILHLQGGRMNHQWEYRFRFGESQSIWHFSPQLATLLLLEFQLINMLLQNWWKFLSAWRAWGPVLLLPPGHYHLAWFERASFHGNDYCLGTRSLATLSGNVKILIWNIWIVNLTDWHVKKIQI